MARPSSMQFAVGLPRRGNHAPFPQLSLPYRLQPCRPLLLPPHSPQYRSLRLQHPALRLASRFTVLHYDRRSPGKVTNSLSEVVEREIDDLVAAANSTAGPALLSGKSGPQDSRDKIEIGIQTMICNTIDLSPDQRAALETLLGRPVRDGEAVSVRIFEPATVSPERRLEIAHELRKYFAEVDSARQPVSEEEAEDVITEAMRSVRPTYRPLP